MKYFLDTEFHEYSFKLTGKNERNGTIEMISIGIVREDGKELYLIAKGFDLEEAWKNEWLRLNVLLPIYEGYTSSFDEGRSPFEFCENDLNFIIQKHGKTNKEIADLILGFVGEDKKPEFYGYYCDYDWVTFCWLFGRMVDLPEGFPMYCRDLKQSLGETIGERLKVTTHNSVDYYTPETIKTHPDYPKQENEHNALADARWNKALYEFIQTL